MQEVTQKNTNSFTTKNIATDTTIRFATIQDISGILPLMAQLGYPCSLQELEHRLKIYSGLEGYGVAVATTHEDKVIGWVAWSKSTFFISSTTRIHIEGLVIDENYRQKRAGKKLMRFVEEYAKQFTPVIIDLTSGKRRAKDGSHTFYRSLGYQNDGRMAKLYFRKEL